MKKIIFVFFICFNFIVSPITAQIKWDVVNDTITLSPNYVYAPGSLAVLNGKSGNPVNVSGIIEIALNEKAIFFNNGSNLFKFKDEDLANIDPDGYGIFASEDLFKKNFTDSILQHYRRLAFPNLNLNEITFSLSKRVEYGFENSVLVLKNQKKLNGKLCYVDLNNIVILTEDGELNKLQEGDFNFLEIDGFKGFSCKSLYNYLFADFERKLRENIDKWKESIKQKDIVSLVDIFGPFDKMINISPDKNMISWKKNIQSYYINTSTSNVSYSKNNVSAYTYANSFAFLNKVSPFFIYGNSYRTTDISVFGSITNTTSSQTYQSGKITSKEEGFTFSIIQESNNKIIEVYQENIFSGPQYGSPFRFISF